jgi:hypothetical protein
MALIYLAIAVLALVGAGAIVVWVRRGEEHVTMAVVFMVIALGLLSLLMFGVAYNSL